MARSLPVRGTSAPARLELPAVLVAAAIALMATARSGRVVNAIGPLLIVFLAGLWIADWIASGACPSVPALGPMVGLFVLSAGIGLSVAYTPSEAWTTLSLILTGAGLFWAIARAPTLGHVSLVWAVLCVLAPVLALRFGVGQPWNHYPAKAEILNDVGRRVSVLLLSLSMEPLHPNWSGGILAMLLPFCASWTVSSASGHGAALRSGGARTLTILLGILCTGLAAFGLLLSVSRGAWVSVGIVGLLWGVWQWAGMNARQRRGTVLAATASAVAVVLGLGGVGIWALGLPGSGALAGRWEIQRFSWLLARDYVFTGSGLAGFEMQLSAYAMLIPVGYVTYSHSMLLDLLIGQGVLGLLAYLWAVVAGLAQAVGLSDQLQQPYAGLQQACVASLCIGLVHGLVDNVQYQGVGLLLMWVPLALIDRLSAPPKAAVRKGAKRGRRIAYLAAPLALVVLLAANSRPVLATWYANLGAVAQARVELSRYSPEPDDWESLDEIRRQESLDSAIGRFMQAIALDPGQVTARQRLASIAMARGDYVGAREHMDAAWQAGHRDPTTRLLLGDAMVATGDVEDAAAMFYDQPRAVYRLLDQAWERYYVAERWAEARNAWRTVLLLEPSNGHAAYWAEEAERRLELE